MTVHEYSFAWLTCECVFVCVWSVCVYVCVCVCVLSRVGERVNVFRR